MIDLKKNVSYNILILYEYFGMGQVSEGNNDDTGLDAFLGKPGSLTHQEID